MSKSGYEIRTEILGMAKDYLDRQHAANVELAKSMAETGKHASEEIIKLMEMYTPDRIIQEAEKLYEGFVITGKPAQEKKNSEDPADPNNY